METNDNKDERLWQMAKKRAAFKKQLFTYIVINAFLWALWWLTSGKNGNNESIPWPVWPTAGWGIGILFGYFDAYHRSGNNLEEREYERLRKKNQP